MVDTAAPWCIFEPEVGDLLRPQLADWPGPNFIGYEGLLQRIRFAVDPETNLFYFGQI